MVGGFNTNIRYGGRVFHVQTEDGGPGNPRIVTLLYEGGAILFSRKTDYEDQLADGGSRRDVRQLMEEQHRTVVQALKAGSLDERIGMENDATAARARAREPGSGLRYGEGLVTKRPLDEVILEHLAATAAD